MQYETNETQCFQLQALEIRKLDADFDPRKPPETGEEYLMHMLYERKRCPAVVTKRPTDVQNNVAANGFAYVVNPPLPPHKCLLPTPEWQNTQADSFKHTRSCIGEMRRELRAQRYDQSIEPPLTTDIGKWLQFCRDQEPLLSTLLRLTQSDLEQLLEMQSKWLQNEEQPNCEPSTSSAAIAAATNIDLHERDAWLARWLYATLVCLHLPLEPHVFSTLRCVARACVELRNQLQPQELQRATPYNLIITIITVVFAQTDFAAYL